MRFRAVSGWLACALVALLLAASLLCAGCGKKQAAVENGPETSSPTSPRTSPGEPAGSQTSPAAEPTGPSDPAGESQAAIAAAKASALSNNPSLGELEVLACRMAGGWARVDLRPADRSADVARWLLRKDGGAWEVVDFGTTLIPSDHPDAPPSVFR